MTGILERVAPLREGLTSEVRVFITSDTDGVSATLRARSMTHELRLALPSPPPVDRELLELLETAGMSCQPLLAVSTDWRLMSRAEVEAYLEEEDDE